MCNTMTTTSNVTIPPKIIMQTWKDANIPTKWSASPASIKKYLPTWKYVLMTDDDNLHFVKTHFPDFLIYYENFPYPIQRADAIRYMWLYINGGIYINLDFEIIRNLDTLIYEYYHKQPHMGGICLIDYKIRNKSAVTNSFMISTPKNPFWLMVIEEMTKPIKWYNKLLRCTIVYETTGPSMLTRVVHKMGNKHINLISQKHACTLGLQYATMNDLKDSYIKSIELTSGESWHGPIEKILIEMYNKKFEIMYAIILIITFLVFVI